MNAITSIAIRYKNVDGWHVFYCNDMPGLYVASQNALEAFNDVGPAIEKLLHLNEGIECKVIPETPVSEFIRNVRSTRSSSRTPAVMRQRDSVELSSRRFAVSC